MILARLLAPSDYGLIAKTAPITGFVGLFKDLGLSMATIQKRDLSHDQSNAVFWINVLASVVLMLITWAVAPAASLFYNDPRVTHICMAMGTVYIFGGLTAQHQALINRQMRFGIIAWLEIAPIVIAILSSIIAAIMGMGYWSLVIFTASNAATNMIMAWIFSNWRPSRPRRPTSEVKRMLLFGANLTGANVMTYLSRNLDNVIIGKALGDALLGLYSKAYGLLLLPISQINAPLNRVVFPGLCRLRDQEEEFKKFYRRCVGVMSAIGMPIVIFFLVSARDVILFFLGPQWSQSVPIFRALAPAAFMGTFNLAAAWAFLAFGHTDRQLKGGIVVALVTIASFFAGLPLGVLGVAGAFSLAMVVVKPFWLSYAFRGTCLSLADIGMAVRGPAVASVISGGVAWLASKWATDAGPLIRLIVSGVSYVSTYAGLMWFTFDGKELYISFCRAVKQTRHESRLV